MSQYPLRRKKNKRQKVQYNLAGITFSEGTAHWGDSVFSVFHRISSAENVDVTTMPRPDYLGVSNQSAANWMSEALEVRRVPHHAETDGQIQQWDQLHTHQVAATPGSLPSNTTVCAKRQPPRWMFKSLHVLCKYLFISFQQTSFHCHPQFSIKQSECTA